MRNVHEKSAKNAYVLKYMYYSLTLVCFFTHERVLRCRSCRPFEINPSSSLHRYILLFLQQEVQIFNNKYKFIYREREFTRNIRMTRTLQEIFSYRFYHLIFFRLHVVQVGEQLFTTV